MDSQTTVIAAKNLTLKLKNLSTKLYNIKESNINKWIWIHGLTHIKKITGDNVVTDLSCRRFRMDQLENKESWDIKSHETKPKFEQSTSLHESYHLKLWIGTIKSLKQNHSDTKTAIFGKKVIAYVDILGTVIDKLTYEKADIYVCM